MNRPITVKAITPLDGDLDAVVDVPGSKSITNRAVLIAALASGRSVLRGPLIADDTEAMLSAAVALGAHIDRDDEAATIAITGIGGRLPAEPYTVEARRSGTTGRFMAPVVSTGEAPATVDGHAQLRARPMGDLFAAIRQVGATVDAKEAPDSLPVEICGPWTADSVRLAGDTSSQFLSGLLLAAPLTRRGLRLEIATELVSRPFVDMTTAVMAAFGVEVEHVNPDEWIVPGGGYRCADFEVEPDASAASYFMAAAALTGGRVRVNGLGSSSVQGDMAFAGALKEMGCAVNLADDFVEVSGRAVKGIDINLADFSDTAPTLAVVAAHANTPSVFRGIGFIRGKESDRIEAVVTELRRVGVRAEATVDGMTIWPGGNPTPEVVQTYDDHRIAMAFSVLGLVREGITIADPGCVAKTFPNFFTVLDSIRPRGGSADSNQPGPAPMRVIAIDGPSGSGKSTVARALAERLNLEYLDTGAMYRSVAFAVLRAGGDVDDEELVARTARDMSIVINDDGVLVDGRDATVEIRGVAVTRAVSIVAANPEVRKELVSRQREWALKRNGGVLEGRDIGTVVFPNADLKVYLTADMAERARRRAKEVSDLDYAAVAADLTRRDTIDSTREVDPLAEAIDAVHVDTTGLSIEEVVDRVVALLGEKLA